MKANFTNLIRIIILVVLTGSALWTNAQLSAPKVEAVFGARVNAITGYSKSSDTTRLFISTESANSIFYTDIFNPPGPGYTFTTFNKVQGADADNNFGSGVRAIGAHKLSGRLFFSPGFGLYYTHPDITTSYLIDSGNIQSLVVTDSVLIYLKGNQLYWGTLTPSGNFYNGSGSPKMIAGNPNQIIINPVNHKVYLFEKGSSTPAIYKTSAVFYALNSAMVVGSISVGAVPANKSWTGMGISPAGRIFLAGNGNPLSPGKVFRYSDSDGAAWTTVTTTTNGVSSETFAFAGGIGTYRVYHSDGYSANQGNTWNEFGNTGMTTHPNDGAVFTDPNDSQTVYLTSDLAISISENGGATITDIETGIEAVQVKDFDMTADKQTAWIASKSGIRKVRSYKTSPTWTLPMFPNGDGSPYYSVAMKPNDTNTVYAGNLRIYKTTNGGSNWNMVFTPESAPYNFYGVGTTANAIEVCPFNHQLVFAGFEIADTAKGGLFYSPNGGTTWNQLLLEATVNGQDVDVTDIAFNIEGGDSVCYVTVKYDLAKPQGRSIYRLVKTSTGFTVTQNMNAPYTSTGTAIVATLEDVLISSTGDTVYAVGTDAGINHPIAYYKIISGTNKWTPFTTSGFPFITGKRASAVSLGADTVFVSVENEIYMYIWGASAWTLGYSYPMGTEINFLYYDELLAGTSTGLYGHVTRKSANPVCQTVTRNFNESICPGKSLVINGKTYSIAGSYLDSLKTSKGCDSVLVIHITQSVLPVFHNYQSKCSGKTYTIQNHSYSKTGVYYDTLPGAKTCDSLVVTHLTIEPGIQFNTSARICDGESWTWRNRIFTQAGIFFDTIRTTGFCDTVARIEINLNQKYNHSTTETICKGVVYTFPDGSTSNQSGTHESKLKTVFGCDSLIITTLIVYQVKTGVNVSGNTLIAEEIDAEYQWYRCDTLFSLIPGATGREYEATESGNYSVVIRRNTCSDTSMCKTVTVTGLNSYNKPEVIVYPNPANDQINLDLPKRSKLIIMDVEGRVAGEWTFEKGLITLPIQHLNNGVYQLIVEFPESGIRSNCRFIKRSN